MNAFEFTKNVISICSNHALINGVDIILLDEPVSKIKAVINKDTYIAIFYNADTVKYSFALIKNNKRIFGADNTRGWHIHPFEDPGIHQDSGELTFADFLDIVEKNVGE